MGKTVYLKDSLNNTLSLNCDTACCGGQGDFLNPFSCEMLVTGNYSDYIKAALGNEGLYEIHNKTGKEVTDKLAVAVLMLGTNQSHDYWEPTEGNVGYCLNELLNWAREFPEGIFKIFG